MTTSFHIITLLELLSSIHPKQKRHNPPFSITKFSNPFVQDINQRTVCRAVGFFFWITMLRGSGGVGFAAFNQRVISTQQLQEHGNSIRRTHVDELNTQLSVFQAALANFSRTHADDIRSNPQFRNEFSKICNAIGVDPLASSSNNKSGGNFWAEMLGGSVNDFYFELAVRVVEVCRRTRAENGGIIPVADVRDLILQQDKKVGGGLELSEDDILQAVRALKPLGSEFGILEIGKSKMIRSIPKELNRDQSTVLEAIQVLGFVSVSMLEDNFNWDRPRAQTVIDDMLSASLVWVDFQASEGPEYWAPTYQHS